MKSHLSKRRFAGWSALLVLLGLCFVASGRQARAAEGAEVSELHVYVGTYTRGASKGIYLCRLNLATGQLKREGLVAETVNPSFLAIHPGGKLLFAVNETGSFNGRPGGGVSAFAREPKSGKLTAINSQSSQGGAPCHLVVDGPGKHVLLANYSGGSVAVLPIGEGGRLGEACSFIQHAGASVGPRQKAPHAHSINLDAAGRFACVADLGLDKVLVYRFDGAGGKLTAHDPPGTSVQPGAGPRHFAFHPGGKFAYVINEIQSTVTALAYDARRGTLTALQTITTLPEGFTGGNSTADVQVHPSGRFLYGSNRGHDSIAIFSIDPSTGKLTTVAHEPTRGKTPRNFGLDPTGRYLLAENQGTGTIVVFRIDRKTGQLTATGSVVRVPSPVCVKMIAVGAK